MNLSSCDLEWSLGPSWLQEPVSADPIVDRVASDADADPELLHLKHRYRAEFRAAFEQAVLALEPAERNALRSHYVLGMTADQMAAAFGIHRATAARRVGRARAAVLGGTRDRLRERLRVSDGELDSMMRVLESQLSASVSRLLEATESGAPGGVRRS